MIFGNIAATLATLGSTNVCVTISKRPITPSDILCTGKKSATLLLPL